MLKHLSRRTQIILLVVLVVLGAGGFYGWNIYSNRYQVKAFSFDLIDNIRDDAFYAAYKAYMSWVDNGVEGGSNKLKTDWRNKLQPYYKNDLKDIRFYYTSRLSGLGMTDCEKIYFGNKDIVAKIKDGKSLTKSQLTWLAHELQHTEQCNKVGGRKSYAVRWFREVRNVVLNAIKSGDFKNIVKDIFKAQNLAKYDDNMAMEADADKKAATVGKSVKF